MTTETEWAAREVVIIAALRWLNEDRLWWAAIAHWSTNWSVTWAARASVIVIRDLDYSDLWSTVISIASTVVTRTSTTVSSEAWWWWKEDWSSSASTSEALSRRSGDESKKSDEAGGLHGDDNLRFNHLKADLSFYLEMLIVAVFCLFALSVSAETDPNAPSECLSKCLTPLAKLQRSFSYVFNNFEKVCDLLEDGAFCARKCTQEDQTKFYQYTTFYRIHCIDYEEDIQEHLTCIAKAAEDADLVCKDKCKQAHKVEKTASKETKMKKECLTLECSTLCYFDELAESCPEARNVLLKINVGQVHSMASAVHPITMEKMLPECQNIHNTEYMRSKLLASSSSLLMDHTPSEMETEQQPVITA